MLEATAGAEPGRHRLVIGLAVALAALGVLAFVVLRLVAPFRSLGVDEAYYLGIGANVLGGRGLTTVFGAFPDAHSPLWAVILRAPTTFLGTDPESWGHPLVVAASAIAIALAGWYAWRSVRLAAPVAVAWLISFPFLVELAGWMGVDLPATALVLLYLAVGITAVRRGSLAMGLAAGLLFATAFLVKESALPFAPVPILAGLLRRVPLASIGRSGAGILLAAVVATSWWFVIYAEHLGSVYRLGTPAWTLVPLTLLALALVGLGVALGRLAPWTTRPPSPATAGRWSWAGWLGTAGWAILLTFFFARTPTPLGSGFLVPAQVLADLERYGWRLWPLLSVAATGAVVAVVDRLRPALLASAADDPAWSRGMLEPDDEHAVDDLVVAIVCGMPFVLLIVSIGEGPRHYLAVLAMVVALGAIGWTKLLVAVARRPRPALLALVGAAILVMVIVALLAPSPSRLLSLIRIAIPIVVVALAVILVGRRTPSLPGGIRRVAAGLVAATLLLAVMASAVWAMAGAMPKTAVPTDVTRTAAVATAVTWIRDHVPAGSTIAFGTGLAHETAVQLVDDYRIAQVPDETGLTVDRDAPLGLAALDGTPYPDWIAAWSSRTDVTSYFAYRAGRVTKAFRELGPSIWVQTVNTATGGTSPMLEALSRAQGVDVLARWSWPYEDGALQTVVYRIDPERLAFSDEVVITADAVERMLDDMERDPATYRALAQRLLDRAVIIAPGPDPSALHARLQALAAGG